MRDVYHALERLRDMSGLSKLEFSRNGHVELVFDRSISVYVVKIDETVLEFVSYLDLASFDAGDTSLKALLRANHFGDGTGPARLALDPADDQPLLCLRVDVQLYDDKAFEAILLDFIKHVSFWKSEEADALLGSSVSDAEGADPSAFPYLLRV
jgi:hypothetical protein